LEKISSKSINILRLLLDFEINIYAWLEYMYQNSKKYLNFNTICFSILSFLFWSLITNTRSEVYISKWQIQYDDRMNKKSRCNISKIKHFWKKYFLQKLYSFKWSIYWFGQSNLGWHRQSQIKVTSIFLARSNFDFKIY